MQLLRAACSWIDNFNEYFGRMVSWATLLLVAVTFTDVVMRYFFNTSYVFTQELEWHIFAFIFLMGAGYTLKHDGHVRVEVFYGKLGRKGKAWINLVGVLFFSFQAAFSLSKPASPSSLNPSMSWKGPRTPAAFLFDFC
jgi:TRAP-type mannitol/chloroaromatic compound transport system permease small subunit